MKRVQVEYQEYNQQHGGGGSSAKSNKNILCEKKSGRSKRIREEPQKEFKTWFPELNFIFSP